MEIWGGIECTLNRVRERYHDQLDRSGHLHRLGDLALIAGLGIRKLRYPVQWERVQPLSSAQFDWTFPDYRLAELQELGVEPIVGLLHHGSGPRWTNLLDPNFPRQLADFALAVAERFPHVRDFTPVNEPLTTARFSALYGHWFPHRADDRSFAQALLNQVEGTMRAMDMIRTVRPDARLIQTEDIAKVLSTPQLAYQANFENARRWITFDMLAGRFGEHHPLWSFLLASGASERQMRFIADHSCCVDVLGANYYVTSERWLDEDVAAHPPESHGGNGRNRYADVAAVRGCPDQVSGIERITEEVWTRYRLPLAITECHLGCTREEQVRWLMEAVQAAQNLEAKGAEIEAVTAWALLGAFDWNSLVTAEVGTYEPGAFDVRSGIPRPTLLARAIGDLTVGRCFDHPVLRTPGWWHRPECLVPGPPATFSSHAGPPILVLGGAGNLARTLRRVCESRGLACRNLSRHEADVCDVTTLRRCLQEHQPWAVVNASGYTLVDEAEADRERCFEVNEIGARNAAAVCAEAGLPYVAFSSDLVFDGQKSDPYLESDRTSPISVYGESKAMGERAILEAHRQSLVIRTSALFDPWSASHFAAQVLMQNDSLLVLPEGRISPTYTVDLCQGMLDLLLDGESGIWHAANGGAVTWSGFAELLFDSFGLPMRQLRGETAVARRPQQSVLKSEKGSFMPTLEDAIARFARDFQPGLGNLDAQRAAVAA